MKSFKTEFDIL